MQFFSHDGFDLPSSAASRHRATGDPVLMIHGFASSHYVNWVSPGWFKTLNDAGYRAIAFDNRGHGSSSKSYDEADYTPAKMASGRGRPCSIISASSAPMSWAIPWARALRRSWRCPIPTRWRRRAGLWRPRHRHDRRRRGDWDPIAAALLADDPTATTHPRGRSFRAFADQTHSDRRALAACIAKIAGVA